MWFGSERNEEVSAVMHLYMTGQVSVERDVGCMYVQLLASLSKGVS